MSSHLSLQIDLRHFDRWLSLFEQAALDVGPPVAARRISPTKPARFADSFETGIAAQSGRIVTPRQARLACHPPAQRITAIPIRRRDDEVPRAA